MPVTLNVPKEAEGKADPISVSDKAKLKAKKALQVKQKKAHLKKKNDNIRLYDKPFNLVNCTTVQLQIDQLDPCGWNPRKLISLLKVAKRSLNHLGRLRHLRHNINFRKKPFLCFPFEDWGNSVVDPWDGELFCAMS